MDEQELRSLSKTAIGSELHKRCKNTAGCGRAFTTHEPYAEYCSYKCKVYAARHRRLARDRLKFEGHDPRMERLKKDVEKEQVEEALAATNTRDLNIETKHLFDAIVNKGMIDLLNAPHIHPEVRARVNKMLIEHELVNEGKTTTAAEPSIVQSETESVLKQFGLIQGAAETEHVDEPGLTDEEKAKEL